MSDFGTNIGRCHQCAYFDRTRAGDLPCGLDGVSIAFHASAGWCADGKFGARELPAGLIIPELGQVVTIPPWGPRLWKKIHALGDAITDVDLNGFAKRLPCGECKSEFAAYRLRRPLGRYESGARWGWRCHNAVNRRLGKTVVTWRAYAALAAA